MLPVPARRQYLHTVGVRRRGNFAKPTTLNEKVNWRILNDRRQMIVQACDKMAMKELALARVPTSVDLRIPKTFWFGRHLSNAPDLSSLPPWVLKPNHGSGDFILGPTPANRGTLEHQTAKWLDSGPGEMLGEWGYTQARRVLILEERINTPDGKPPVDYKFFVFHGIPHVIQVNSGRGVSLRATFYDSQWRKLPVKWWSTPTAHESRPDTLELMCELAARLARGWDFVRVDLYSIGGQVWFGEYSPYPGGGLTLWEPRTFDYELGKLWKHLDLSHPLPCHDEGVI